jgi:hypothetical protein
MIYVGVDWAEVHHDVCIMDADGQVLERKRISDSLTRLSELHALVADHLGENDEPGDVIVGIEKDRGLIVMSLLAANYQIFAINPIAAARYRERHVTSGAKSDPGDAKVLADLVRTDRHNHRAVAGDSTLSEAIKLLSRVHQNTIWNRQRQVNSLRSALKDYYPGALEAFGTDLSGQDAVAILAIAPTPSLGRTLSRAKITSALRKVGRSRHLEERTERIYQALRQEQLRQPAVLEAAYGVATETAIANIVQFNASLVKLEASLSEHFEQHQGVRPIPSGARASQPQQALRGGARPMGLQLVASFSRCPPLLQRTEGPRQAPPKGHPSAGQQVGRDPARVPRKWHSLRREHRVVTPPGTCRLTFTTKGCLRPH